MPRALHLALLALLTALLCLQPAVSAGASCAQEMLTGACGCAAAEAGEDAHACCAAAEDDGADQSGPRFAGSDCACELAPVPHASLRVAHERAATGAEAAATIALAAALPCEITTPFAATVRPARDPHGGASPPHDLASRSGAVRFLTFLCTSRR